ncbi:DNA-formamidopyrimidine glycosylase family protein [Piscinibacter koreensis]|uniref:Endonuclease n=1 Tax=Piscinibacter koreensis TaxID=2742824 RepID=A0A7Y6NMT6_9BURK|nr:endonuclease [Schlegelella koreensis]
MPEGPSIVILKDEVAAFAGRRIASVDGNTTIDTSRLVGQRIVALRSWGKHFLVEFDGFALRIHLLMFGTYRIDERREDKPVRLGLRFDDGSELNFYTCSVRFVEGPLDETYEWSGDVMSPAWNPAIARRKLRAMPDALVCDALLDQTVFAGVGNIIKNEVLFRIRVHPLSAVGALPARKLAELVEQARIYSFEFLEWKRAYVLRQHWLAHTRRICPRCDIPFVKAYLGTTNRRSFFCERCQRRYGAVGAELVPVKKAEGARPASAARVLAEVKPRKAPKPVKAPKAMQAADASTPAKPVKAPRRSRADEVASDAVRRRPAPRVGAAPRVAEVAAQPAPRAARKAARRSRAER